MIYYFFENYYKMKIKNSIILGKYDTSVRLQLRYPVKIKKYTICSASFIAVLNSNRETPTKPRDKTILDFIVITIRKERLQKDCKILGTGQEFI